VLLLRAIELTFYHLPAGFVDRLSELPRGSVPPDEMGVVGHVHHGTRFWAILYSLVGVSGDYDMSDPINAQVRAAGGDGVSGLAVTSDGCNWNGVPILDVLPFWPGCVDLSISGNIVKMKPKVRGATKLRPSKTQTQRPAEPVPAVGSSQPVVADPPKRDESGYTTSDGKAPVDAGGQP